MSHLIQALDVPGLEPAGLFCVKHGASTPKWRTVSRSYLDIELAASEDADQWQMTGNGIDAGGAIKFGTCCLWKATVRFFLESDAATYIGDVSLNGVSVGDFIINGSAGETVDIVVDLNALGLMGRACGNIWDITAIYADGTVAEMSFSIIDVTFGPPV
jgi:hypothetical protein